MAVRTLEGDVDVIVKEGLYLMIGLEGEVYPIREEKLNGFREEAQKNG